MPPPVHETSVRDLIQTVSRYAAFLLRRWYILLAGALLVGGYLYYQEAQRPSRYVSAITFVVNGEKGGGGGLGAVLGQFGLGGGAAPGGENLNRVMAFATSRYMINRMLLDTVSVGGRDDLLGNHLIAEEDLPALWDWDEEYTGPRRLTHPVLDSLSVPERGLLRKLYSYLTLSEDMPLEREVDEDTGVLTLSARTRNEELALHLSEGLYNYLSAFYTKESSGQAQASVDLMQVKADSLLTELNAAEYRLASNFDSRQNLSTQRDQIRRSQLNRRVQILAVAYTELVRNLETAKFSVSTSKPYFQPVDVPFLPLPKSYPNPLKGAIIGAVIGAVLATVCLSLLLFYREAMNDPR